jgi:hypothetical protein
MGYSSIFRIKPLSILFSLSFDFIPCCFSSRRSLPIRIAFPVQFLLLHCPVLLFFTEFRASQILGNLLRPSPLDSFFCFAEKPGEWRKPRSPIGSRAEPLSTGTCFSLKLCAESITPHQRHFHLPGFTRRSHSKSITRRCQRRIPNKSSLETRGIRVLCGALDTKALF